MRHKSKCQIIKSYKSSLDMNHLGVIEQKQRDGLIYGGWYRPFKLLVSNNRWYEPSYCYLSIDGRLCCETVKTKKMKAAESVVKEASKLYPFIEFRSSVYSRSGIESFKSMYQTDGDETITTRPYASGLERHYSNHLEMMRKSGSIHWFHHECVKFRLAAKTYYTPDYMCLNADGSIWCEEVKGFWKDDARVKFKAVADIHPYIRFRSVSGCNGCWRYEDLTPKGDHISMQPRFENDPY